MCPNHVEHYLDINMLKSTRLSDRLNLWNEYNISSSSNETDRIIKKFLSKCRSSGSGSNYTETSRFDKIQGTCIPESIKEIYSNPIGFYENNNNSQRNDDETESEDESHNINIFDENEFKSVI
jgi:hypothetical protein